MWKTTHDTLEDERLDRENQISELIKDHEAEILKIAEEEEKRLEELEKSYQDLADYSQRLINKIRKYEEAPDYSFDFLTAFRVISDSKYRSE